jgi:hypothetical protein
VPAAAGDNRGRGPPASGASFHTAVLTRRGYPSPRRADPAVRFADLVQTIARQPRVREQVAILDVQRGAPVDAVQRDRDVRDLRAARHGRPVTSPASAPTRPGCVVKQMRRRRARVPQILLIATPGRQSSADEGW